MRFSSVDIGLYRVHHLSARIPNYELQRAHDENPMFHDVPTLWLWDGLRCVRLKVWGRAVRPPGDLGTGAASGRGRRGRRAGTSAGPRGSGTVDLTIVITAPVRLGVRALDDIHTLAKASGDAVEREQRWADAIDALQERIEEQRDATRESTKRQSELVDQLELLDERLGTLLEKVGAVEEVLPSREAVVSELERMRGEMRTLVAAAQPVGEAAGRVERLASHLPGSGAKRLNG